MTSPSLTGPRPNATFAYASDHAAERVWAMRLIKAGVLMLGAGAMSGCINVAAPDEPIVIELNINIRQEVIYRLAEDAAETVEEYSDIY